MRDARPADAAAPKVESGRRLVSDLIKPERLRPGDIVAAISLSSGAAAMFPQRYEAGKRQLERTFGVHVIETPHALEEDAWLYDNPMARADDLHWALENPSVDAIVSTIGGDDSVRILPYLDLDTIRRHPKIFMGFSDATITLMAFLKAGVHAFHGPAMMTDLAENGGIRPFVEASIRDVLFDGAQPPLPEAREWTEEFLDWGDPSVRTKARTFIPSEGHRWLQGGGSVQGHLMGGNIEALEWIKATPWWPDAESWHGAVLVFETSEEAPPVEHVGRFLRGYGTQGILESAAAVLFARPMRYSMEGRGRLYDEIRRIAREFGREEMPIVANLDFGHTSPQMVLPLGGRVEIDVDRRAVRSLEAAVR